jgi:hypothetical protein
VAFEAIAATPPHTKSLRHSRTVSSRTPNGSAIRGLVQPASVNSMGRLVDKDHPSSRGNCRMLETPPDEPIVEVQHVDHESRVHLDIETDDIPAGVARLEKLGAKVVNRLERWVVMQAPTDQRFCFVRVQRPGFPKNANSWD